MLDYQKLTPHPLAALFPKYGAKDLKELVAQQQIVLFNGQILDGVNRWKACMSLNMFEPGMFRTYYGPDPIAFVISANLKRRHLDIGQRAMIAAELATMRQGERTDKSPSSNSKSTETAAKQMKVSPRSVVTAKAVRKADPALADDVKQGKTKLAKAAKIVAKRSPPPSPAYARAAKRSKEAKRSKNQTA